MRPTTTMKVENKLGEPPKRVSITFSKSFKVKNIDRDTPIELNDQTVEFCLGEKQQPPIGCVMERRPIDYTYADSDIRIKAPSVAVDVTYYCTPTVKGSGWEYDSDKDVMWLSEKFTVNRSIGKTYIPLNHITDASNMGRYWTNDGDAGFMMGNDGIPDELLRIEVTLTVEGDGEIIYTPDSHDEGAFCVTDDGYNYNAVLMANLTVSSIWTNEPLSYALTPSDLPTTAGLIGNKPFEKSSLTVRSTDTAVVTAEIIDYDGFNAGLRISPIGVGEARVDIFVNGRPGSVFSHDIVVYDKYALDVVNPPFVYQPQNSAITLSTIQLKTNPEGNVIRQPTWKVTGAGSNYIDRGNTLRMALGLNDVVCTAYDVANLPMTTSFTVESYATFIAKNTFINIFENETFELDVKFSTRHKDNAGNWIESYNEVPENFSVEITNGEGVKNPNFILVGKDPETGKYKFKLATELLADWNAYFYVTIRSIDDPKNFAVSYNSFSGQFKYITPSITLDLDKTSLDHYTDPKEIEVSGKFFKLEPEPVRLLMGEKNITMGGTQEWLVDTIIEPNEDGTYKAKIQVPDMYDGIVVVNAETSRSEARAEFDYVAPMIVKIQAPAKILITGGYSIDPKHKIDWGDGEGYGERNMRELTDTALYTVKIRSAAQAKTHRLTVREYIYQGSNIIDYAGTAIKEVVDWGRSSFNPIVRSCNGLIAIPDELPTSVTSLEDMLRESPNFNLPAISNYDISRVTDIDYALASCISFNQPLNWDYSAVTSANGFLSGNKVYNQPMPYAKFSSLASVNELLYGCTAFSQDLTTWCVPLLTVTPRNFAVSTKVTADKYPKWGTCPSATP